MFHRNMWFLSALAGRAWSTPLMCQFSKMPCAICWGDSPPTALFFGYDEIALAAMMSLLQWGYRVPEEISIVGFDDSPGLASRVSPALTTLRMPTDALAARMPCIRCSAPSRITARLRGDG